MTKNDPKSGISKYYADQNWHPECLYFVVICGIMDDANIVNKHGIMCLLRKDSEDTAFCFPRPVLVKRRKRWNIRR